MNAFSVKSLKEHISSTTQIYFIHKSSGEITEFLSGTAAFRLPTLRNELIASKLLTHHYNLDRLPSFTSLYTAYQKPSPDMSLKDTGIITNLPLSRLYTKKIAGEDLYFGHITLSGAFAGFKVVDRTSFVLIDMDKEEIAGYDKPFFRTFGYGHEITSLIGRKVADCLMPTPFDVIRERSSFLPPAVSDSIMNGESGRKNAPLPALDVIKDDWSFVVDAHVEDGRDVYVLLGSLESSGKVDDSEGYFFGLEGTSSLPVIKRCGYIAARGKNVRSITNNVVRIGIEKVGRTIALDINGKREAVLHDADIIEGRNGLVPEIVCKKEQNRIVAYSDKRSKNRNAAPDKYMVCRKAGDGEGVYHMEPYYTSGLSEGIYRQIGGFLIHDVSDLENKILTISSALEEERKKSALLQKKLAGEGEKDIIGNSSTTIKLRNNALRAAATESSILVKGATGTGKGFLAKFIHDNSNRKGLPFVHADLSSLPETLLYSELFGHKKGAFTGAHADRAGLVVSAESGTLFLDEIASLSKANQASLLRFLNDRTYVPLGSEIAVTSDARIILSTSENLEELVRRNEFREDLLYRIQSLVIGIAPLSERRDDIALLANYIFEKTCKKNRKHKTGFTQDALKALVKYPWPGNVRELFAVVERAVIMSTGTLIEKHDLLFFELPQARKQRTPFRVAQTDIEVVKSALVRSNGIVKTAASMLGIDRRTLYNYMTAKNIDVSEFRHGINS